MNWDVFEDRIEELFSTVRFSTGGGRVRVPEAPIAAFDAFRFAAEDEEEREYVEFLRGAYGFLDVVEPEYPVETLITFHWHGGGESWVCAVVLHGGGRLLYFSSEGSRPEFLALIEGEVSSGVWSTFALDLLGTGGAAYGFQMLAILPPGITASWADPAFVKEGCRRFLDGGLGGSRDPDEAWRRLRDELIGRALEERSFRSYRTLPEHDSEEGTRAELSPEDRELILDNYFDLAFR